MRTPFPQNLLEHLAVELYFMVFVTMTHRQIVSSLTGCVLCVVMHVLPVQCSRGGRDWCIHTSLRRHSHGSVAYIGRSYMCIRLMSYLAHFFTACQTYLVLIAYLGLDLGIRFSLGPAIYMCTAAHMYCNN